MRKIISIIVVITFPIVLSLLYFGKESYPYVSLIIAFVAMVISWYTLYESFLKPLMFNLHILKISKMAFFKLKGSDKYAIILTMPLMLSLSGASRKQEMIDFLEIILVSPIKNIERWDINGSFYHDISFLHDNNGFPITNSFINTNIKPIEPLIMNANTITNQYVTSIFKTKIEQLIKGNYKIEFRFRLINNRIFKKRFIFLLDEDQISKLNDIKILDDQPLWQYQIYDIPLKEIK